MYTNNHYNVSEVSDKEIYYGFPIGEFTVLAATCLVLFFSYSTFQYHNLNFYLKDSKLC